MCYQFVVLLTVYGTPTPPDLLRFPFHLHRFSFPGITSFPVDAISVNENLFFFFFFLMWSSTSHNIKLELNDAKLVLSANYVLLLKFSCN